MELIYLIKNRSTLLLNSNYICDLVKSLTKSLSHLIKISHFVEKVKIWLK